MAKKTFEVVFNPKGLDSLMKNMDKLLANEKALSKVSSDINQKLSQQTDFSSSLMFNLGNGVETVTNKLNGLLGGSSQLVKPFEAFSLAARQGAASGMGLFGSLQAGVSAFGATATATFGGLMPLVAAFGTAIMAALGPIALIAVAIFALKKAWDNNLGGIQTQWNKIMGKVMDIWGKFDMAINQFMREISPIFEPLFSALFGVANILLDLVIPAFKVLGVIFKVAVTPLRVWFKYMQFTLGIQKKILAWFLKLPFVQKYIQNLVSQFNMLKDIFVKIWEVFKPIIEGFEKLDKFLSGDKTKNMEGLGNINMGKGSALLAAGGGGGTTRTTNVSNNVAVHSAGPIGAADAPRIGDAFAGLLAQGMRGG